MCTQKLNIVAAVLFIAFNANAQVKGNYDYRANANSFYQQSSQIQLSNPAVRLQTLGDLTFSIRGLYNAKADAYLAIFTTTQVGKTQKEANQLLQAKIDSIRSKVKSKTSGAEMYVDMISFVPLYEIVKEKKRFSKSYNEIPMGFELKKNLHFKYTDPAVLEFLVTICAENEIYDLVRVDYFVENMEKKKDEMIAKAEVILKKKIARYGALMDDDFLDKNKILADGFAVHYPVEQYQTYTAYCSNSLNYTQADNVKTYQKVTSQFYMPKFNKGYDFVINSAMLEPVVQIEYEISLRLVQKPEEPVKEIIKEVVKTEVKKDIYFITPDGQVRKMNF